MSDSLVQQVHAVFAPDGALARATEGFQPRAGQTEMALAVAETIAQGGVLVVEAGTGVGKTFSYLVPALLSGEKVLLSTATKTLQDQLYGRDLPRLIEALALPLRTALLKGRGSYLCWHRLEQLRQGALPEGVSEPALARVERWAQATRSGDLAELPGLDERSPMVPWITSTRENCLGSVCPRFRACHVQLARREALAADLVVVNHHLFFADLAVRESGMAELLPSVRVTVFDEAHQLNETGVLFLGERLGTGQLLDLVRDLLAAGLQHARGLVDWPQLAGTLEHCTRDLRLVVGRQPQGSRLRWKSRAPEGVAEDDWFAALQALQAAAEQVRAGLDTVSEIAPDFVRLHERVEEALRLLAGFAEAPGAGRVRWLEVGAQLRLIESPLDIAQAVRSRLLGLDAAAAPEASSQDDSDAHAEAHTPTQAAADDGHAWVFTSATLGDDPQLRWFTEPCGLEQARLLRVGSPFDYTQQAALYVPRQLPRPNDPGHSAAVAVLVAQAARALGGRTLVLTTTLRALRVLGEALQQALGEQLEVLVQGHWPKRRLMERFRQGQADGQPGCVLVASASFWEGVDIPGDALQLVVIDKLPFPPPGDPLVEARSEHLEALGRSPFTHYFLPEAAVVLKQGAGRLIRRESDRGLLVLCDTRLLSMGYGRRLLAALPPMRRLDTQAAFEQALAELTTASTTASS